VNKAGHNAAVKLIILDRDGVINHDSDNYIKSVQEWQPIAGSIKAIALLKQAGYYVAIATNQSGIARGYYNLDTLQAMHAKMQNLLASYSVAIDYIAFCPHAPDAACYCRKPKAGMLLEIARHFQADLSQVTMVGDTLGDLGAAQAAGTKFVLVKTGKGERVLASRKHIENNDNLQVYNDLLTYVQSLLSDHV
jgi:D-glycero-D-manno-heptose 1,7-bisphosphate phosphatase